MRLRVLSDVHLEYRNEEDGFLEFPDMEDKESTLILAGDIHMGPPVMEWLKVLSPRFKYVLFVPGNHDYWGFEQNSLDAELKDGCKALKNVHYLVDDEVVLDGVHFIGAVLWADFDQEDPETIRKTEETIPDFQKIKVGNEFITAAEMIRQHKVSKNYIFERLKSSGHEKRVVITHYLPSYRSLDPNFAGSPFNGYFASELKDEILETSPNLWIHGHTHASCDYKIGDTRVICNPFGYLHVELNPAFSDSVLLEV